MASFAPPKPSTYGEHGGIKEIGQKKPQVEEKIGEVVERGSDDEIGEDLTPVRREIQHSDFNQIKEHEGHIQSSPVTEGERTFTNRCFEPPLYGMGKVRPVSKIHFTRDVTAASTTSNISGEKDNAVLTVNAENYRTNTEVTGNASQVSSSSRAPQIRIGDASSIDDFESNKKLRITCEFHAKGWCIRGTSCRFLHSDEALHMFNKKAVAASASDDSIPPQRSGDSHNSNIQSENFNLPKDGALGKTPLQIGQGYQHNSYMSDFSFSFCNTGALVQHNHSKISREHHPSISSSVHQRSSMVSGSQSWSNDWEPSIPFRPSHYITRNLLMKENLYDPVQYNIAQSIFNDGLVEFAYSNRDALNSNRGNELKFDEPRLMLDPKVDGSSKRDGQVVNVRIDDPLQIGSSSVKYFQAALIQHVKELLEPAWLEGHMSKDAYKLIVKKSVDKVIQSFPPNQIPSSSELVKLYIASSQAKLEKLVEGYRNKYGKS